MTKLNDRKYGPKVGAKQRDKTAKRYVTRKATFGAPSGRPSTPRLSYVPKSGVKPFRATNTSATNTYKPPVTSATVRPNSTGYVKKTFTPRTPNTPSSSSSFTPPQFKKSTSWSKSKMEKGKFAEKRAPYVPRDGARVTSMSKSDLDIRGGKKPVYKSKVPNKPRTASASWGEVASWYDAHLNEADTYHEKVILPNLLRLIDAKPTDAILDLACGQGFFTRAIKKTGAKVEGVDIAPELIAIAKAESPLIPYHVASADKLDESPCLPHSESIIVGLR